MKSIFFLLIAGLLLVGEAGAGAAPPIGAAPKWRAPLPEVVPARGPRTLLLRRSALPLVHILALVQAGAEVDPIDRPGLSAAVAEMLEEGGAGKRSGSELALAIEQLGTRLEVHAHRDGVAFTMTVLADRAAPALDLLGELLTQPRFAEAEWPRVKERRLAELKRILDEPRRLGRELFTQALHGDQHPLGRPRHGTLAGVAALTVDDLRRFHSAHYGPATTRLLLAGDLTAAQAKGLVEHAFGDWRSTAAPPPQVGASANGPRFWVVDRPGAPQSMVVVGAVAPGAGEADEPALELVETALGGSFTSRLVQNLRERHGYTYGVNAGHLAHRGGGELLVASSVRTDVTGPALREILSELQGIHKPMAPAELGKARKLIAQGISDGFADGRGLFGLFLPILALDRPIDSLTKLPDQLQAITPPKAAETARRWITMPALTVVIIGDRQAITKQLEALPEAKRIEIRDVEGRSAK